MNIQRASIKDAERILEIQKLAYICQAEIYNDYTIPPLTETIDELIKDFDTKAIFKATFDNKVVGSIRATLDCDSCYIGRLSIHPDYQNKGIGTALIDIVESTFDHCVRFELFTGHKSENNIRLYERLGYKIFKTEKHDENTNIVYLEKYMRR